MDMLYKEDWEETRQRFEAWWRGEWIGRAAIGVTAPRETPIDVPAPPQPTTLEDKWYDLDQIAARNERTFAHTYYGGEAFPIWNPGYPGTASLPTMLGCPLDLDMRTGWWDPILTDPDCIDWPSLAIDRKHPDYHFMVRMLERAAVECPGKAQPSVGAFGGCGDTLAALRGTEELLMDCIMRPGEVHDAEMHLMRMWCEHWDERRAILGEACEGSTCWFPFWSPGKFYAAQNDFAYNVGPEMFRDLFLPAVRMQTEFLDHTVYHVDGVGNFVHIDTLCELPRLQALQVLPGAGKPSAIHYLDACRRIQAAGKNLQIMLDIGEVEEALRLLSAKGLFITTRAGTEKEARELLRNVEKWSQDR